jgi:hypothetical protein
MGPRWLEIRKMSQIVVESQKKTTSKFEVLVDFSAIHDILDKD